MGTKSAETASNRVPQCSSPNLARNVCDFHLRQLHDEDIHSNSCYAEEGSTYLGAPEFEKMLLELSRPTSHMGLHWLRKNGYVPCTLTTVRLLTPYRLLDG
jgi:hypothetical protein